MSYVTSKKIGSKRYFFLVKAVRMEDDIKKITFSLGTKKPTLKKILDLKEIAEPYFFFKESELKAEITSKKYSSEYFSKEEIKKIEILRHFYKIYLHKLKPPELQKHKENFMVKYVYNTTSIEGNTTTLPETALILLKRIAPEGKELREIYEIQNYEALIEYMDKHKGDVTKKLMLKIHEILLKNIDEYAGNFRKVRVFIPGSEIIIPKPEKVETLVEDIIGYYYESRNRYPLELAVDFHHKFESIHPFTDGNGRVGRELLNFILKKHNFPPVIIEVKNRQKYIKALMKADEGNIEHLITFVRDTLINQYDYMMDVDIENIKRKIEHIVNSSD